MLPISKSCQLKQEMSNIKQFENQNYVMFSVKISQTLESSVNNLNNALTLSSFLKLPHCTEKSAVVQKIPAATPRLIIERPMSCSGICRG